MNIVITGASRGIGYELAKILCTDPSNNVIALSRSEAMLKNLKAEINTDNFKYLAFDLSTKVYNETLIPFITTHFKKVDVLIHNAGALVNKPLRELSEEDFRLMFDVNVKSVFKLVRDLLPYFNKPAHVVSLSSMGGVQGSAKFPGLSLYSASKGAVAILSECLAEELKEEEIKVNALAIGAVQTEMLSEAFPGYKAPLEPHEMASYIADFALNGHKFYNGKILPVSVSTP
jgi:short-subunit dehydrogenase